MFQLFKHKYEGQRTLVATSESERFSGAVEKPTTRTTSDDDATSTESSPKSTTKDTEVQIHTWYGPDDTENPCVSCPCWEAILTLNPQIQLALEIQMDPHNYDLLHVSTVSLPGRTY